MCAVVFFLDLCIILINIANYYTFYNEVGTVYAERRNYAQKLEKSLGTLQASIDFNVQEIVSYVKADLNFYKKS